jgi:hypothetical protein
MNLKTQASWMWATLVRLLVTLVVGEVLAQAIIRRYGGLMAIINRYLR